jgi:acetolactate synthase small subunit
MLRGIDGRSAIARRYRDLVEGFVADFGSQKPGERELALIRQAAALTVQTEVLQVKIVRAEDIDLEQLTRLTNVLTRTLKELGLQKRRTGRQSLADYLAQIGSNQ